MGETTPFTSFFCGSPFLCHFLIANAKTQMYGQKKVYLVQLYRGRAWLVECCLLVMAKAAYNGATCWKNMLATLQFKTRSAYFLDLK